MPRGTTEFLERAASGAPTKNKRKRKSSSNHGIWSFYSPSAPPPTKQAKTSIARALSRSQTPSYDFASTPLASFGGFGVKSDKVNTPIRTASPLTAGTSDASVCSSPDAPAMDSDYFGDAFVTTPTSLSPYQASKSLPARRSRHARSTPAPTPTKARNARPYGPRIERQYSRWKDVLPQIRLCYMQWKGHTHGEGSTEGVCSAGGAACRKIHSNQVICVDLDGALPPDETMRRLIMNTRPSDDHLQSLCA